MIQKPPTTSFVSGNGPSVTFDFPPLKVTRALIVAGGVRPSSASSTPAFPSSSLYAPIFSMSFILGTKSAFAASYSFGNMIIMKRIVFSLSVERTPYQGRYFYIGAWAALGTECCECPVARSRSTYASNRVAGNDMRFANFSRSVSPRETLSSGPVAPPSAYSRTSPPEFHKSSRFFFSCRIRSCTNCPSASCSAPARAFSSADRDCPVLRGGAAVPVWPGLVDQKTNPSGRSGPRGVPRVGRQPRGRPPRRGRLGRAFVDQPAEPIPRPVERVRPRWPTRRSRITLVKD